MIMEEKIYYTASRLFCQYGFKSVSMDDLAASAGVSKKTIYQFVADKNELVQATVKQVLKYHLEAFQQARTNSANAVEEVLNQAKLPFDSLASVNRNFFYELEKFFPESWSLIETHRRKVIYPNIISNLERGEKEELYRELDNKQLIADIRFHQFKSAFENQVYSGRLNTAELILELSHFYLHAITNTKGKKLIPHVINI